MSLLSLRLTNDALFYSASGRWEWTVVNLPKAAFGLRLKPAVYWTCRQTGYAPGHRSLKLEVLDYAADPAEFNPDRQPKAPVERVTFAPLDAMPFLAILSYYRLGELRPYLVNYPETEADYVAPAKEAPAEPAAPSAPTSRPVNFRVPLLDLEFVAGAARGRVALPGLAEPTDFRIPNPHLIPEFQHVRVYLVKRLRRKTAEVSATLVFAPDGTVQLTQATSPQLAAINDKLLAVMRARGIRDLLNLPPVRTVDKDLFTPDELFGSLDDDHLGKVTLPQDGQALLDALLNDRPVRNARQLRFLAAELQPTERPLRFVLSPSFGFVFLARGQDGHHFILELLDSHATYVWSLPRGDESLAAQYRRIEQELEILREIGREGYRRAGTFGADFWFLVHAAAESGVVDGFPRWRNRLLEGIW